MGDPELGPAVVLCVALCVAAYAVMLAAGLCWDWLIGRRGRQ